MANASPKGYRVLICEDEGLIAQDIAQRLETLGHTVVATVSTFEEATVSAVDAEVVLMDIRIDGTRDGIEAATAIRDQHHVPVIFLTAHADKSTLERAKAAGPFGYIVKPMGSGSLQASIELAVYKHAMDRRLEEREARLRTSMGSVSEALVVTDVAGAILMMNPSAEQLTGWTEEQAKGRILEEVLQLIEEQSRKEVRDLVSLAMLQDGPVHVGRGIRLTSSKSKRETLVEGSVSPVRTSEGPAGTVVSLHDVGARQWEEQQLRQAQRIETSSHLAATVAGEYSNLIGIIRNRAGQLLAQFGEYSPARAAIEDIQQAAASADQTTRRLAAFGTRQPANPENLSVNAMLRRMSKLIEEVAGANIRVAIHPRAASVRVRSDAAQLEQAIMSLVMHACSVTPAGGSLEIETETGSAPALAWGRTYVSLLITYSGAEPSIERMFDPEAEGDSGLALARALSIVAEQSGYLSARSHGGGTRIEILLPISEEAPLREPAAPAEGARTILLVDSRERVRAHLHNVLEAAGYNMLEAADREEAVNLAEVRAAPLDLLIAPGADAAAIIGDLPAELAPARTLKLVESQAAPGAEELAQPFTQKALLAKIGRLLSSAEDTEDLALGATSSFRAR